MKLRTALIAATVALGAGAWAQTPTPAPTPAPAAASTMKLPAQPEHKTGPVKKTQKKKVSHTKKAKASALTPTS